MNTDQTTRKGDTGNTAVAPSGTVHDMTPTTDPTTAARPAESDHPTTPRHSDPTGTRPATVIRHRTTWSARVDSAYASAVLIAPLAVAGWFQSHAANARLDLPWFWAICFTVAWEGAAGYIAKLYLRALLRGDSTVALRTAMMVYAAASCGLLWWDLDHRGKPPHLAIAVGVLALSGIFLWVRRARDLRRDDLHARGLVDAQVVKFGFASWLAAPLETPAALRYAIKNRISHPVEAIEAYRSDRDRRRMAKALRAARVARRSTRPEEPTTTTRPAPAKPPVDHPTTAESDHPTTRPARRRRKPTTPTRPVAKKTARAKPTTPTAATLVDHPTTGPVGPPLAATIHGPTAIRDAATIRADHGDDQTVVGFPGRNELLRIHGGNAGRWSAALKAHADRADQPTNGHRPDLAGVTS